MRPALLLLGGLAIAAAFGSGYAMRGRAVGATATTPASVGGRPVLYWVDPMHPAYRADAPGIAPDCGMALEPVYADQPPGEADRQPLYYRDPKVPAYTSTSPGTNPATGNALEPVYSNVTPPADAHTGAFRLPTDRQQLAGVTFATVALTDTARTLRTSGTVAWDETRVHHVHARVDGFVEQVLVDYTGQPVRKGQPLLTIYSPELLASQEELLLARRARETMARSPLAGAASQAEALFAAARRRLQLWDLSEAQIDQVLATGTPIRHVTLYAPASGLVLQRNAFPHQRITSDTDLYTLADLSSVWVLADVYEPDLPALRPGTRARISVPGHPGQSLTASVSQLQAAVDPATRTLKARLDVRNPGLRLRPEMFVDVEFQLASTPQLTVPADAVLDSGGRQVVFVDLGDGYLAARPVSIGARLDGRVVILSGVAEGERIVASGTFLVNAESQLRSALATMPASPPPAAAPAPVPAAPARPPAASGPAPAPSSGDSHAHHGHD